MPARPASTLRATASLQFSPAASSNRVPSRWKPVVAMRRAVPSRAAVSDDQVAAAADDEERGAALVRGADGLDHLGVGGRGDQTGGGATEAEGGQGGEGGVVEFLHVDKSTVRTPRIPAGPRTVRHERPASSASRRSASAQVTGRAEAGALQKVKADSRMYAAAARELERCGSLRAKR